MTFLCLSIDLVIVEVGWKGMGNEDREEINVIKNYSLSFSISTSNKG